MASVSIIIPSYNRLQVLKQVLPSYLSQAEAHEVIVVDDASKDGTGAYLAELAKTESKLVYLQNKVNQGLPASKNIAVAKSTGDYIFIGEDDLELTDGHISKLLEHMKLQKADIIAGRRIWIRQNESPEQAEARGAASTAPLYDLRNLTVNTEALSPDDAEIPMLAASMLIDKLVFDKISFDDGFKVNFWSEETDFQFSAIENGYKLVFCPHTETYHWPKISDNGGSHSSSKLRYEVWVAKNTMRLGSKHRAFLRKTAGIKYPRAVYTLLVLKRDLHLIGPGLKYITARFRKPAKQAK